MKLVLASRSPQRVRLLTEAGYVFETDPADIDESDWPTGASPEQVAEFLAVSKAVVVAARQPGATVIAADTVVVSSSGNLLGKPVDADDAKAILNQLSGTTHRVITGLAVYRPNEPNDPSITDSAPGDEPGGEDSVVDTGIQNRCHVEHVTSVVHMRPLTPGEIDIYIATNDWQGKAGGYGIQDDDPFVTRIDGSFTNIVGLPMERVEALLPR